MSTIKTLKRKNATSDLPSSLVECNYGDCALSRRSTDDQHAAFVSRSPANRMVHKQYTHGFSPLSLGFRYPCRRVEESLIVYRISTYGRRHRFRHYRNPLGFHFRDEFWETSKQYYRGQSNSKLAKSIPGC